jgi:quinol monooxygenase YgiN
MGKSIARIKVKKEKTGLFKEAVAEMAAFTRAEKGCVFYELYQMKDDPSVFFFVEEWKAEEDLRKHLGSLHVKSFVEKTACFTDGEVQPFFWNKVV